MFPVSAIASRRLTILPFVELLPDTWMRCAATPLTVVFEHTTFVHICSKHSLQGLGFGPFLLLLSSGMIGFGPF